jgi:hypothetical protein
MAIDIQAAQAYNKSKAGVLWNLADLPWPYKANDPASEVFAQLVAAFQQAHALKVDGCLGPATLSTMRTIMAQGLPALDDQTTTGPVARPNTIPARLGCSNKIIISGQKVVAPLGMTCTNFLDDGEPKFKFRARTNSPTHVCLHESVTRDAPTTVRILQKEGYGTHLMVCPDGHITQHNDLVTEQVAHANQLNGCSIGIEIVNPYCPMYSKPPFTATIPAEWWTWIPEGGAHQYVLPTKAQIEALRLVVPWLTKVVATIPLAYPTKGLNAAKPRIEGWNSKPAAKPLPGIVAHSDFSSHADGRYELEVLIGLRPW